MTDNEQMAAERVLDFLEARLSDAQFDEVDVFLENAKTEGLSPAVIITILTITYHAKDKLTKRDQFLADAEMTLNKRIGEDRAKALLLNRI